MLEPLGLHVRSSDQFLLDLLALDPARAAACVAQAANKRRNPPITIDKYLSALAEGGAARFARTITHLFDTRS